MSDMEETPGIGGGEVRGRGLDPAAKRNLVIMGSVVGAALLGVAALAYMGLRSDNKPVTQAGAAIALGNPTSEQRSPNEAVSPRMQEQLRVRQTEEAENAARQGKTYIPPDASARIEPLAPQQAPQQPALNAGNSSAGYAAAAIAERTAVDVDRRKGLEKFLESFKEVADMGDGEVRRRFGPPNDQQQQGQTKTRVAQGADPAASAAAAKTPPGKKLVEAFSVMATRLALPLKIPANGSATVLAEVVSGPQTGALLSGTARVVDEGIEIKLTQARFGSEPYAIQAIGLDGQTSDQILNGSVDRKLFQRYVIPISVAAAQGFFTAKALTGSAVVGLNVGGSSGVVAGVQTPPPSTQQAVAAGLGAGMGVLAADAAKQAAVPIVVALPAQSPMGVLFTSEVIEKAAQP